MKVNVKIKVDKNTIKQISENVEKSMICTVEAIKTDLFKSRTMPFGNTKYKKVFGKRGKIGKNGKKYKGRKIVMHSGGTMQNKSTFVDSSQSKKGRVSLITDTPYARKMYFHPEYNFNKTQNKNAQGRWLDVYITGAKKDFAHKFFAKTMKKLNRKMKKKEG